MSDPRGGDPGRRRAVTPATAGPDDLVARVRRGEALVLDGGLATELERAGHDLSGQLWSARLLRDDPEAILAVHRAFRDAGAEVLTTASYQASVAGYESVGVGPARARRLIADSVALARRALDATPGDGWVAGSCGAYGASLADGSEYRGRYGVPVAALVAFHAERAAILLDAGADLLAFETLPSHLEAVAVAEVLAGLPQVAAWASFTSPDGRHTPEGVPLEEAAAPLAGVDGVVALGVNCLQPAAVGAALEVLRPLGTPLVVYPNAGDTWDGDARRWLATTARATPVDNSPVGSGRLARR
ncbi:MAG TPA: homocysteine S-methyltransferase [Euzebya sp.]|nr:homocysteine S-methyltransferase [Euzebya sp.]